MRRGELVYSIDEISSVAGMVSQWLAEVKVVAFVGTLGAGKTTLIQEILRQAGIESTVQSPTFTYMVPYTDVHGITYYHFDLYRFKSLEAFINEGFSDYLYQPQSYALIEWPEIIMPLLKKNVCFIALDHINEDRRRIRYELI